MRILFLCGSIEPGRDGVGDYVRLLAKKLTDNMFTVSILALSTHHIMLEQYITEVHKGVSIETLSIPTTYTSNKRITLAKNFVNTVNPEIISLQFVIFSYQKKGLPFMLAKELTKIAPRAKWHIMFHEIWIGLQQNVSLKYRFWGYIQQQIIRSLINRLKPVKVHTHTHLYKAELELFYKGVAILPLFSNIPKPSVQNSLSDTRERLRDRTTFCFVIFGTIHPGAPISEFAHEAADYAVTNGIRFVFEFVGRNGQYLNHWLTILEAEHFKCIVSGERDVEELASILESADAGLTSSAFLTIEKSGTVAAFRDFGLPVLCIATYWEPRISFNVLAEIPGITNYKIGIFKKFMNERAISFKSDSLDSVATLFMNDISTL